MPPRHRFLEPIHNVKEGLAPQHPRPEPRNSGLHSWSVSQQKSSPPSLLRSCGGQPSPIPVGGLLDEAAQRRRLVERAGFEPAYACAGRFTVCCL